MEKQVQNGLAKSIGLSNFNQSQVLNVYENAEIKPSNLQVPIMHVSAISFQNIQCLEFVCTTFLVFAISLNTFTV